MCVLFVEENAWQNLILVNISQHQNSKFWNEENDQQIIVNTILHLEPEQNCCVFNYNTDFCLQLYFGNKEKTVFVLSNFIAMKVPKGYHWNITTFKMCEMGEVNFQDVYTWISIVTYFIQNCVKSKVYFAP